MGGSRFGNGQLGLPEAALNSSVCCKVRCEKANHTTWSLSVAAVIFRKPVAPLPSSQVCGEGRAAGFRYRAESRKCVTNKRVYQSVKCIVPITVASFIERIMASLLA